MRRSVIVAAFAALLAIVPLDAGVAAKSPLELGAHRLRFEAPVGSSDVRGVTITNGSTASITINYSLAGDPEFSIGAGSSCLNPGDLEAGSACFIFVRFDPITAGRFTSTLTIRESTFGTSKKVGISGTGT